MNKKVWIVVGVLVLLLMAGGGFFFLNMNKSASQEEMYGEEQEIVGTLQPEDIGLKLVPSFNNKRVKIIVEDVSEIKRIEYEVIYDADIPASEQIEGETGGKVERGFSGEADIKSSDTKYESKDFDLGSCSKNVCRYDTGVEKISVLMKVIKKDGKVYQVEDSIELE